jgi:hypothetical protein
VNRANSWHDSPSFHAPADASEASHNVWGQSPRAPATVAQNRLLPTTVLNSCPWESCGRSHTPPKDAISRSFQTAPYVGNCAPDKRGIRCFAACSKSPETRASARCRVGVRFENYCSIEFLLGSIQGQGNLARAGLRDIPRRKCPLEAFIPSRFSTSGPRFRPPASLSGYAHVHRRSGRGAGACSCIAHCHPSETSSARLKLGRAGRNFFEGTSIQALRVG